jgi:hypothetical protein
VVDAMAESPFRGTDWSGQYSNQSDQFGCCINEAMFLCYDVGTKVLEIEVETEMEMGIFPK